MINFDALFKLIDQRMDECCEADDNVTLAYWVGYKDAALRVAESIEKNKMTRKEEN